MIMEEINNDFKEKVLETINDFKREIKDLEIEKSCTIALDFDGSCTINNYPYIGEDNYPVVEVLKEWIEKYNVGIVLHTMRDGKLLEDAVNWFKDRNIPLYGINEHPMQKDWKETSKKTYAQFCIDDRNVGTPLIIKGEDNRACVDWFKINEIMTPILEELSK